MAGKVLSEEHELVFEDICEKCEVPKSKIFAYIEEGVVEVRCDEAKHWRFSEVSIVRIQQAHRLEQDLRLNPAGAALALDLMAKIEKLKNQLKRFQRSDQSDSEV